MRLLNTLLYPLHTPIQSTTGFPFWAGAMLLQKPCQTHLAFPGATNAQTNEVVRITLIVRLALETKGTKALQRLVILPVVNSLRRRGRAHVLGPWPRKAVSPYTMRV